MCVCVCVLADVGEMAMCVCVRKRERKGVRETEVGALLYVSRILCVYVCVCDTEILYDYITHTVSQKCLYNHIIAHSVPHTHTGGTRDTYTHACSRCIHDFGTYTHTHTYIHTYIVVTYTCTHLDACSPVNSTHCQLKHHGQQHLGATTAHGGVVDCNLLF
jgi:hypothetical protein